jgi:hypothetical protein
MITEKRFKPEQILTLPRQIEVELAKRTAFLMAAGAVERDTPL